MLDDSYSQKVLSDTNDPFKDEEDRTKLIIKQIFAIWIAVILFVMLGWPLW